MSVNWKDFSLRTLVSLIGITFISLGASLSETMDMGLDPFNALNRGASELLGFDYGTFQLVVNLIILAIIFFVKRDVIGWGTIYNMVLVGYQVDFFGGIFENLFQVDDMGMPIRIAITIGAILVFALGVAMYMDIDMGIAPYDAITPVLTDLTGWNYGPTRIAQDIAIVIGAYFVGGPVGVSTIITGFFAGPLISFFSNKITKPLEEKVEALAKN